jgi:hypothetical protein
LGRFTSFFSPRLDWQRLLWTVLLLNLSCTQFLLLLILSVVDFFLRSGFLFFLCGGAEESPKF